MSFDPHSLVNGPHTENTHTDEPAGRSQVAGNGFLEQAARLAAPSPHAFIGTAIDNVPLFAGPSVRSEQLGTVIKGQSVVILESGGWLKVIHNGSSAYVPAAKIELQPGAEGLPDVGLDIAFFSQFASGHGYEPGDTACFKAAVAMAAAGGATVLGSNHRIQVGLEEGSKGELTKIDATQAAEGIRYINEQLDAGRPVVVGVSHKDANYNVDSLTDHFVVITSRTTADGATTYGFTDPGTSIEANSAGTFTVDADNKLVKTGNSASGYVHTRRFEVSMIRMNEATTE
ncbi:MAG: hypothetical protein ACI9WU_002684 [Myxococcota bacterium]|jgi:hypothetical protein